MPITPKDFVSVANTLGNKSVPTEAELRTAVGRIYYALYHVTSRRLIEISELQRGNRQEVHSTVVELVKGISLNLGEKLDRLRMMRRNADYRLSVSDDGYRASDDNWLKNYLDAKIIADRITPGLEKLVRK
jgi:uncharacterized protein (UPF0332 family)